jgi:glycosyltransferase involved in cell wall biosynthesis
MKIVFLTFFSEKDLQIQINKLRSLNHEVIFYDCHFDKSEEFRFKTRHFQMYENVLNFTQKEKADILYLHDYLNVPEFLLHELKVRPEFTPKIVFSMQLREVNRSLARANTIKELLDMPQLARAMTFSMGLTDYSYPKTMIDVGTNFNKIKNLGEPFNENPNFNITKEEARRKFGIPQNAFVILWSGRWVYSKGPDIFLEAIKKMDKDIFIFAHSNPSESDYSGELLTQWFKRFYLNSKVISQLFKRDEMKYVYCAANLAICSHRKIYEYAQSGIPGMAALAKIPIIAPDFNYFNEIIKRYKVGIIYTPEDPIALAHAINNAKINYNKIVEQAQFEKSLEGYINFEDIPVLALEGI